MKRPVAAEALGSFLLFATVVGSGIMAEALAGGNVAVALLANTLATGAMLFVLITMIGPISGAHFNPAVTLVMWRRGEVGGADVPAYVAAQLFGGIAGVWAAHAMFDLPIVQMSDKPRTGTGQWLAEFVATFGLLLTIIGTAKARAAALPAAVALYIVAAYWFTASTSFANPAISVARALTDSFSGIASANVPAFVAAQIAGAFAAHWTATAVFSEDDG